MAPTLPATYLHALTPADRLVVAQLRAAMRAHSGLPSGVALRAPFAALLAQVPGAASVAYEAATVGGVPGCWCRPVGNRAPASAVLYLHGGAYVAGSAASYRHFAGQLAACAGVDFFVADYRLAPEHSFPAAGDDARAAYQGLVALAALARANQAAAASSASCAPCASLALSPWTDLTPAPTDRPTHAPSDYLVTSAWLTTNAASYLNGHDAYDPQVSPVYGTLAGLPPLQLHVGTTEVLRQDAERYTQRARDAGVAIELHEWEDLPHVFPTVAALEATTHALRLIGQFLFAQLVVES